MKMTNALGRLGLVAACVLASACSPATTFISSWRSPKAEPLYFRDQPVAAVVMHRNEPTRRSAEDTLAREITYHGAKGIPMYTIFEDNAVGKEKEARAAVEKSGVKGVVVMRPMGTTKKTETSTYYDSPYYGSYWGGYYGYGWAAPYGGYSGGYGHHGDPPGTKPIYLAPPTSSGPTTYTTTTEVIEVEVLVYSLAQNMLVWAGRSQTTEAENVDQFVTELCALTAEELVDVGLIATK